MAQLSKTKNVGTSESLTYLFQDSKDEGDQRVGCRYHQVALSNDERPSIGCMENASRASPADGSHASMQLLANEIKGHKEQRTQQSAEDGLRWADSHMPMAGSAGQELALSSKREYPFECLFRDGQASNKRMKRETARGENHEYGSSSSNTLHRNTHLSRPQTPQHEYSFCDSLYMQQFTYRHAWPQQEQRGYLELSRCIRYRRNRTVESEGDADDEDEDDFDHPLDTVDEIHERLLRTNTEETRQVDLDGGYDGSDEYESDGSDSEYFDSDSDDDDDYLWDSDDEDDDDGDEFLNSDSNPDSDSDLTITPTRYKCLNWSEGQAGRMGTEGRNESRASLIAKVHLFK